MDAEKGSEDGRGAKVGDFVRDCHTCVGCAKKGTVEADFSSNLDMVGEIQLDGTYSILIHGKGEDRSETIRTIFNQLFIEMFGCPNITLKNTVAAYEIIEHALWESMAACGRANEQLRRIGPGTKEAV